MHRLKQILRDGFICAALVSQLYASDWNKVGEALGRAGNLKEGVYKLAFPRTDLTVHIGGTRVEAGAALGSWLAFRDDSGSAIANGDLVVTESELDAVISALQDKAIEVTAIHNHLAHETPRVLYVHFFGQGEAEKLASSLAAVLHNTKTPIPPPASPSASISFDRKAIETALGKAGEAKGVVLAFSFPRGFKISMEGKELPPSMGMATAINFQPGPQGVAATGDFVLREEEVGKVTAALRKGDISITAMHNHMMHDEPHLVFVHFWAEGKATTVAESLREALRQAK